MTRQLLPLLLWLWGACLWAAPAKRIPFTVTNSDGTVLTLVLCGDENYHFYTTTEGIPVVQDSQGDWQPAPEQAADIAARWKARAQRRQAHRTERARRIRARREWGQPTDYIGEKRGLVILVNFADLNLKTGSTQEKFSRRFNEEGYSEDSHIGSVHDYFYDQSYGKFNLTFDVVGPVKMAKSYTYYGENGDEGEDLHVAELAAAACQQAHLQYSLDWSRYDWDGDGEVDQVYIIYAGYGESAGAPSYTVWPHEWSLSAGKYYGDGPGPIELGGYTIDTYAMSCELASNSGIHLDGIGTACHEFSHCLGFPDFYDTSYDGGFGMNYWDVMDAGCYNGPHLNRGEVPVGFTAYERWFAGWLDFTEIDRPTTVTNMPSLGDEPVAYILYNGGTRLEYFTLENRQNDRWFKYASSHTQCHGMLVCHVDYDETAWLDNEPNLDADHQRMTIVPAGGELGTLSGAPGSKSYSVTAAQHRSQLFPGSGEVTELTDTSHETCGGKLYNRNTDQSFQLHKPITHIVEADGLLSFDVMGGGDAPTAIASLPVPSDTTSSDADKAATSPQASTFIYYRLDGTPVLHPTLPGIYLQRTAEGVRKVVLQ